MPKSRKRHGPQTRPHAVRRPTVPQVAPGRRGAVERASAPVLVWMSRKPTFTLPVLSVLLLVVGLAAPVVIGAPVLLVLTALVGWLSYLSWPAVQGVQRILRLGTLGLLLAAVAGRLST